MRSFGLRHRVVALGVACGLTAVSVHARPVRPLTQVAPSTASSSATTAASKAGTGAISGIVTDATTGQPVADATVTLGRVDNLNGISPRRVTDRRGRFVFANLPADATYFLGASSFGYGATRYGWTGPDQSPLVKDILQINLADHQWIDGITIPLWRFGVLSGRVIDERGEPVVGVAVRAFSMRPIAGEMQWVAGSLASTDDRGAYRLTGLEPDRYIVCVLSVQSTVLITTRENPPIRAVGELQSGSFIGGGGGVSSPAVDVDGRHRLALTNFATPPPPSGSGSRAYPQMFYPAARTAAQAAPIDVDYGDDRTGLDVELRPAPAVRVSGRLDAGNGTPPPFLLRLMPAGGERLGFGSEVATTIVEADGSFTFSNVPDGAYTILAQPSVMDFTSGDFQGRLPSAPGFPGAGMSVGSMPGVPGLQYLARNGPPAALWGRLSIVVGDSDVDDVVVPLHPTVKIHGRIVFIDGARPPSGRILMTAQPASGDPTLGNPYGVSGNDDPTFSFTIENLLAGPYLIGTWADRGIVSVTSGGRDVTDTGLDASLGRDFDDVVVTMTDRKIVVKGVVRDRSQPASAGVIAFPSDRARWTGYGWSPPRFCTAQANSTGAYELDGLPAGDYDVIAVDVAQRDAWVDPKFLEAAAPLATRLSVAWGDAKTLDLTRQTVVVK